MTKIAYIMRGVPGSGKSRIAKMLAGQDGVIHSTDRYFMVGGRYVYDPSKLSEYHARNRAAFEASLRAGVPVVICDNTNIRLVHMQPYVEMARAHSYEVRIVEVAHPLPAVAAARNSHGATIEVIERMLQYWEPWNRDF